MLLHLIVWQEFKFNPNAKSFVPSQTSLRPSSPAADSPFYYPANVASMTQMHAMPVGIGVSENSLLQIDFCSYIVQKL